MRIIYPHPVEFPNRKAHSILIVNTCFALAEEGIEVILVVSKIGKKSIKEFLDFYGLPKHPNLYIQGPTQKFGRKKFNLFLIQQILRHRKEKDTIFFLTDQKLARILILLRWFLRIPCVVETHGPYYSELLARLNRERNKGNKIEKLKDKFKIWRQKNLEKFIYRNADGTICTTEGTRERICKDFLISRPIEIICNAARISGKEFQKEGTDILYLGQLYSQKGVDNLVKALKYLPDRNLVIVGGNKEEDISRVKKLAYKIGVDARIEFIGYVCPQEVEKYFKETGVGVIPIVDIPEARFTSPMKLFEYMAAKVPIVASDLPAIREILVNGTTAVLVEPDNPKALAEGIEKVLTDREFARKITEEAYKKVQDFTWEKRAKRIKEFLENILYKKDTL